MSRLNTILRLPVIHRADATELGPYCPNRCISNSRTGSDGSTSGSTPAHPKRHHRRDARSAHGTFDSRVRGGHPSIRTWPAQGTYGPRRVDSRGRQSRAEGRGRNGRQGYALSAATDLGPHLHEQRHPSGTGGGPVPGALAGDEPEELEVVPWQLDRLHELALREDCSEACSIASLFIVREVMRERGVRRPASMPIEHAVDVRADHCRFDRR